MGRNVTEKLIEDHLVEGEMTPGTEIGLRVDQTLTQDATGTVVTAFYDWSNIDQKWRDAGIFPVLSEAALRATLGILDRTVRRGYPRG